MATDKTIIRTSKNRENPYVMIDKFGLNDDRLSLKAKGLLCYLLSKPDDWTIYMSDLIKCSADGRDSVRSALKELQNIGYLSMKRIRDEKGHLRETEYVVYERPIESDDQPTLYGSGNEPTNGKSVPGENDISKSRNGKSYSGETYSGKSNVGKTPPTNKRSLLNNDLTKNDLTNKSQSVSDSEIKSESIQKAISKNKKLQERLTDIISVYETVRDESGYSDALFISTIQKAIRAKISVPFAQYLLQSMINNLREQDNGKSINTSVHNDLPEWIRQQLDNKEVAATAEELDPEEKKKIEELLRLLGEID